MNARKMQRRRGALERLQTAIGKYKSGTPVSEYQAKMLAQLASEGNTEAITAFFADKIVKAEICANALIARGAYR